MGYLEIKCHQCGATNTVYADQINPAAVHRCPHCLMKMNTRQWEKLVDAFYTIEEVNKGLRKIEDEHGQLFQVEYKTYYVPAWNIMPQGSDDEH